MPPKILVAAGAFPVLSQTFVLNQVESLLERGFDVTVAALKPASAGPMHAQARAIAARVRVVTIRKNGLARAARYVKGLMRGISAPSELALGSSLLDERIAAVLAEDGISGRFDAILCHFALPGAVFERARAIGHIAGPLAVFFHGSDVPSAAGAGPYRRLASRAEACIANSAFTKSRLASAGLPTDRVRVLPVGFFPERFALVRSGAARPGAFFSVARLVEKKGLDDAIRALAIVRAKGLDARLTLFGEGPKRAAWEGLARALGVGEAVTFAGPLPQEDFARAFAAMDAFVLPSVTTPGGDMEGQGLALAEAQAMGFPVLATRHNGFPDSLIENETGYLVAERAPEALAEKMIAMISDRALAARMGSAGRVFACQRFDQRRITAEILKTLKVE